MVFLAGFFTAVFSIGWLVNGCNDFTLLTCGCVRFFCRLFCFCDTVIQTRGFSALGKLLLASLIFALVLELVAGFFRLRAGFWRRGIRICARAISPHQA